MVHFDDSALEVGELPDGTPARLAVQCARCGGWLVSPASIRARLGPVCAAHASVPDPMAGEPGLFDLPDAQEVS